MSLKEQVMKRIQEKTVMSNEEFENIYNDMKKVFEDRGVKPTEDMILNRLLSYLEPSFRSSATKHYGIFLGVDDNFGFNKKVDTVKFDSLKQYQENPELALSNKIVFLDDEKQVHAVWHSVDGVAVQDWQLGKVITNLDYSATAYILDETEKDKNYNLKKMKLTGDIRDKVFKEFLSLQGKRVSFMAIDKDDTTLYDSKYTKFIVEEVQLSQDLPTLLKNYVKKFTKTSDGKCLDLKDVQDFYTKNADKSFKGLVDMPIFVRVTTQQPMISELWKSNTIPVIDGNYTSPFAVYLPKHLGIPYPNVPNTIFGGRLKKNEDKADASFVLNGFMFWQDKKLIDMPAPKSIGKYTEVDGNVQQSLELIKKADEQKNQEQSEQETWG